MKIKLFQTICYIRVIKLMLSAVIYNFSAVKVVGRGLSVKPVKRDQDAQVRKRTYHQ